MTDALLSIADVWAKTSALVLPGNPLSFIDGQFLSSALMAGLIMLGLGLVFSIVLLIAHEKLKVPEDPRVTEVTAVLPHLDCGACGYPGCGGYAQAVIANPELIGRCSPGGAETANKIAEILNLQISSEGPAQRPIVHCRAHRDEKTFFGRYVGIPSCTSANALANAQACKFGCLGFGDCVRACKFDALHVIDRLATVDYDKCTGCSACSKACPRNLIEMVPFGHENMMTVACRSRESGKMTRQFCQVGCIGCGICAKQSDAFTVEDNLARMDYAKYEPSGQNEAAYNKCPTGVIVYRGRTAPAPREPKAKKPASGA
jgi:Na+-translocating ferredoxin:NAD+ oxidoreductase RNF subunit RnfB